MAVVPNSWVGQFCCSSAFLHHNMSLKFNTLSLLLRAAARVSVNCAGSSLRLNKPRASPPSNNAQISVFNGILVFASVMATLGLQVILESMRTLFFYEDEFNLTKDHERWVVGSMLGVTLVKLLLIDALLPHFLQQNSQSLFLGSFL